jgi:hypothetical protein
VGSKSNGSKVIMDSMQVTEKKAIEIASKLISLFI